MKLKEIYSAEHGKLYDYLKSGEDFYPHDYSPYIIEWARYEFSNIKNMNEELDLDFDVFDDFDDLHSDDAEEIYNSLSPFQRKKCENYCKETKKRDYNSEAPSYLHMQANKKIPRNTWLIHFSDQARNIWYQGFKYGTDDHEQLGLTTYYQTGKGMKSGQGWNFAFIAKSKDLYNATHGRRKTKYGKDAVMFMSSGIEVYHHSDEENQVIFQGKYVNHKDIVYLHDDGGTWEVISRTGNRSGKPIYKNDEIEKVIDWVIANYRQYKNIL